MSGASNPAIRSSGPAPAVGHALVVAHPTTRGPVTASLQQLGFTCDFADDPYAATLVLCRSPVSYQAVVLGLAGLFKEELAFIESVKRRFGASEVWLTQTDGRQATLVEAMRLGADALLSDEGLYRLSTSSVSSRIPPVSSLAPHSSLAPPPAAPLPMSAFSSSSSTAATVAQQPVDDETHSPEPDDTLAHEMSLDEPVLTADELRALLHEPHGYGGGDE